MKCLQKKLSYRRKLLLFITILCKKGFSRFSPSPCSVSNLIMPFWGPPPPPPGLHCPGHCGHLCRNFVFYVLFISFICKRFNGLIIPFIWLHWAYLWLAALIYDFARGPERGVWQLTGIKPKSSPKRNETKCKRLKYFMIARVLR